MGRWRKEAGIAAAVGALLCGSAPGLSAPTLEEAFQNPPMEARPRLRWWWPGGAVQDEELARELDIMKAAGFGGAEIQAFNTGLTDLTPQERADVNEYATPKFFAHVHKLGEAAAQRGMNLDYTFGSAWPSGGGFAITPELALTELTMSMTEVKGGGAGPIKVTVPTRTKRFGALSSLDSRVRDPRAAGWIGRFDARQKLVAVVAMKGAEPTLKPDASKSPFKLFPWSDVTVPGTLDPASAVILTDRLRDDGTLDWVPPPGTWQVLVFKQYASNMGVSGAAGQGPQLTLDHMNPQAFAAHAARVGDPLGHDPAGLRATFVDSLELMQDIAWTPDFLTQFRALRGYDLTPYLPFVLQPGWMQAWGEHYSPPYFDASGSAIADRVRADFRQTVSDLTFRGFIDPLVSWSHAHGLKAKFQAHGGPIDVIRGYGVADIPETEDLVDGGNPYMMRLARSGADLYGKPIISAESMVWLDRPYDVTLDEMRRRADLIFAGGVNSINIHGINYIRGTSWPGNHAFQPSAFSTGFSTMVNPSNPIWIGVPTLAQYIGRTQAVLQQGVPVVPVAYFYGQIGYYGGIEDKGAHREQVERALVGSGYDYDRINPDAIAKARVERRQLVSAGGHRYSVLLFPAQDAMRAETAETVARFARGGLPVVFLGHAPSRDVGLADAAKRDARVRAAVQATLRSGARIVPEADVAAAVASARVPANLRFLGPDVSKLVFVQRKLGTRTVTFVHNTGSETVDASMVLPGVGGISRWDAMTGGKRPVSAQAIAGGTQVPLTLSGGESALLVLDPTSRPANVPSPRTLETLDLSSGWSLSVKGYAPRSTPFTHDYGKVALGDWRKLNGMENFAGTGTYRQTVSVPPKSLGEHRHATLDLGKMRDMAVVTVNGKALPPTITSPYRVDLTSALKPGANDIQITVATTPQNAMIDPRAAGFKNLKSVPTGIEGPITLQFTQ